MMMMVVVVVRDRECLDPSRSRGVSLRCLMVVLSAEAMGRSTASLLPERASCYLRLTGVAKGPSLALVEPSSPLCRRCVWDLVHLVRSRHPSRRYPAGFHHRCLGAKLLGEANQIPPHHLLKYACAFVGAEGAVGQLTP